MSCDFIFALYVFCCDFHGGQTSRLYRILSRIASRGIRVTDHAEAAIRRGKDDPKQRMGTGPHLLPPIETQVRQRPAIGTPTPTPPPENSGGEREDFPLLSRALISSACFTGPRQRPA